MTSICGNAFGLPIVKPGRAITCAQKLCAKCDVPANCDPVKVTTSLSNLMNAVKALVLKLDGLKDKAPCETKNGCQCPNDMAKDVCNVLDQTANVIDTACDSVKRIWRHVLRYMSILPTVPGDLTALPTVKDHAKAGITAATVIITAKAMALLGFVSAISQFSFVDRSVIVRHTQVVFDLL